MPVELIHATQNKQDAFEKNISSARFDERTTVGGSECVVVKMNDDIERPLIGFYRTETSWMPCTWLVNGMYVGSAISALDLLPLK